MSTIPVGPPTTPSVDKPATPSTPHTPSQDDQSRFSKALKDDPGSKSTTSSGEPRMASDNPSSLFRRREGPDHQHGQDRGDSRGRDGDSSKTRTRGEPEPTPSGEAILRNLAPPSGVDATSEVERPAPTDSSLSDMVSEVADRILVGESSATGQQEVRILLKDNVLGGTEISISEQGGAIELTFAAATKDIENFLANRQEEIATSLGERLDREVKVAVTDRDRASSQSGDERGRDGEQNRDGQPNDGRSRNQRSVRDEREN